MDKTHRHDKLLHATRYCAMHAYWHVDVLLCALMSSVKAFTLVNVPVLLILIVPLALFNALHSKMGYSALQ